MGIVEAVKKGFGQVSKFLNVILIFFVYNLIVGFISLPLANPAKQGDPATVALSVVASIVFLLAFIFLQGGALGLVKDHLKTGSNSISNFVEYGKKFYLRILGLILSYIVVAIGVVLLLGLISAGLLLLGDNAVIRSIVFVIITIVSVGLITLLVYPIYAVVADDIGPIEALKKGVLTAKSNFKRTLGLFLLLLVISLAISLIVGLIIGLVSGPLGITISQILAAIVNAAVQSYLPIVMMIAFMSFYMSLAGSAPEGVQESLPEETPGGEV